MRVVIIGNGVAGMEAALGVRARQPDWDVTIVSEESDHYFSRTALMWVFCGQMSQQDIEPLERDAYQRLGFRRVRARAVGLDTDEKKVFLAGGLEPLAYDRLLIASGSTPRPGPWPGSNLRGTGHFVTMQDLAWYEAEVHGGESRGGRPPRHDAHLAATTDDSPYRFREAAAAKRGRLAERPAIIGGGLIGIEAIEIAVAAGLRPHFFIREDWFWPIALEPREATWIGERLAEHGVEVEQAPMAHADLVDVREAEYDAEVAGAGGRRGAGFAADVAGGLFNSGEYDFDIGLHIRKRRIYVL